MAFGAGIVQLAGTVYGAYRGIRWAAPRAYRGVRYRSARLGAWRAERAVLRIRQALLRKGMAPGDIESNLAALERQTIRYGRRYAFWKKYYRFYTRGKVEYGGWVYREMDLLGPSPLERRIALALPAENLATAKSYTRIPFRMRVATGMGSHMPPDFTHLPAGIVTGGRPQVFLMGEHLRFWELKL